jgi:hypothetical protein
MLARCLLAIPLLAVLHLSARAQGSVKGRTVDDKNNLGIGFVTVSLLSSKDSTTITWQIADSAGVFLLPGVRSGRYLLLFSASGFQKLYRELVLQDTAGNVLPLGDIPLSADAKQLDEVVVSAAKPAFQRLGDRLVLNISGNRLFKASANVLDILKRTPGLEVTGEGALQLSGRITPAIFIDGKPALMSPEELQNYLTTLSPDMIASIEIITNPSSRYDAEYKGIIDIRLKRDMTLGWKGNITTSIQQNAYTQADNTFLLTYKTRKFTYTTRLGYTKGTTIRRYHALQHLANTNIMTTNTKTLTGNNNFNYQLSVDYSVKEDQHIEMSLRSYRMGRELGSDNTLLTTDSSAKNLVSNTHTDNNSGPVQDNYAASLDYTGRVGKARLQITGSLVQINNRQNDDIQTRDAISTHLSDYWKTALKNTILIRTAQADLSGNAGNGKWGAGARLAFTTTKNDLRYDTLNSAAIFVPDSGRSNNFHYSEYITAGYFSYEGKVNKFDYAVSMRVEHTQTTANAITLNQVTQRNYLRWLPSLSVNYTMSESKQLRLSYTRRMTRPNFAQLNPFRFYSSPLNYWMGNPYLQPSTTNVLSISYSRKAFNISFNIGRESDPMTRYPEYDSTTNILEYLGRNLPYNDFAGIETSFPFSINKWWKMSHTIGGYYTKEQTPYHGIIYSIPVKHYTISGSQVFSLPKGFTFDAYYYYRSIGGNGLYIYRPVYNIDLGLQKAWLKGKLNSRLNFYDVFNTYKIRYIFREKSIINNQFEHWFGMRKVVFALGYSFGRSTHTARQNSKNEEETRAGL